MMKADGFDDAIIGIASRFGQEDIIAYDYDKCCRILVGRDKMSLAEAEEFMDYNVLGAYVGEGTPTFISRRKPKEVLEDVEN
jgi:hypothetical protein